MSFSTKYRISWENRNSGNCEVLLQKDGYTGSVTDLSAPGEPFEVTWGKQGEKDLSKPLLVSTARIRFRGDSDGEMVSEIFDAPDKEWRVKFNVGGSLYWQGFLATDLWKDNPNNPHEVVELEALDGIALLENQEFDLTSKSDLYTITRDILHSLHSLDVVANMEWYPYRSGNQLNADTLPLKELEVGEQAFDELEPIEGEDGYETTGKSSTRRVLEAVLERFGMEAFQNANGEWIIRQRHRIQPDGTLNVWENQSAVTNNNRSTRDLSNSLSKKLRKGKPRSRVRRLQEVNSTHSYSGLGELIRNGSFEGPNGNGNSDGWTNIGSASFDIKKYDNTNLGETQTQEDTYVAELSFTNTDPGSLSFDDAVKQDIPALIQDAGPKAAYKVSWEFGVLGLDDFVTVALKTETGYKPKGDSVTILRSADASDEDGELVIDPLPGSNNTIVIPEKAELPIKQTGPERIGKISLSEPARAGDEKLIGSITDDVPNNNGKDQFVEFVKWVSGSDFGGLPNKNEPDTDEKLFDQKVLLPQRTPSGDVVDGDMEMKLVAGHRETPGSATVWIDHISLQIVVDGSPVEKTSYTSADTQSGSSIELEQLIGDGPTANHPKSLDLPGVAITRDWKNGAYASGASPSGENLEEVTAENWLRQQRETVDRRAHLIELRNGATLNPEDVFEIDGNLYTVTYLRRRFGQKIGDRAEVELTQLKDAGTSGLERTYRMESSSSSGGGGGGGSTSTSSGSSGGGASSWDQLSGKPSELFARSGNSDGFDETAALQNSDIDGAATDLTLDNLDLTDTEVLLNSGASSGADSQLSVNRGADPSAKLVWDESENAWRSGSVGDLDADLFDGIDSDKYGRLDQAENVNATWTFDDLKFSGTVESTGAATGFSGSGVILDQTSWFDDVEVRGTFFAREFEIKKLTVSRGTEVFSVGGGKVQNIVSQNSNSATLEFEENPGIKVDDYCLIKETNASDGTVAAEIRLQCTNVAGTELTFSKLSQDRPIQEGDDVVVVASPVDSRGNLLTANPYTPAFNVLDSINSFSEWDYGGPKVRLGKLDGLPNVSGNSPTGQGLYASNAYLEGTLSATDGYIANQVTIGSSLAGDIEDRSKADDENLMPRDGRTEHQSDSNTSWNYIPILWDPIEDYGLSPGDTISVSVEAKVTGNQSVGLNIAFQDSGGNVIQNDFNTSTTATNWTRNELENVTIPSNAAYIRVAYNDANSGTGTSFTKWGKLNKGPVATEYGSVPTSEGVVIRSSDPPRVRPNGEVLQDGDTWLDAGDGDRPYVYDASETFSTTDTFEDGVDGWVSNNAQIGRSTAYAYNGAYSFGGATSTTGGSPEAYTEGEPFLPAPATKVVFHYLETSNSFGGAVLLKDEDGNLIAGFATDNPEWQVKDGEAQGWSQLDDGTAGTGTAQYEDWHRIEIVFDWGAKTYDLTWENLDQNYSKSWTGRDLRPNIGGTLDRMELWNFSSGAIDFGSTTKPVHLWLDDIEITTPDWLPQYTRIDGGNIITQTITANQIDTNTITASEIAADTITASEIDANTITASEINTDSVLANDILANSADITNTLTMGSGGLITNTNGDFELDADGLTMDVTTGNASAVTFEDSSGNVKSLVNGFDFGSSHYLRLNNDYGKIQMTARNSPSGDVVRIAVEPDNLGLVFETVRSSHVTGSELTDGDGVIYLYQNGTSDIELWAATQNFSGGTFNKNKLAG